MTRKRAVSTEDVASETYRDYYAQKGADRNDPLGNPEVLWQQLMSDAALVRALRPLAPARTTACVLDVGCGAGNTLLTLIGLGFPPRNLSGIDVLPDRLAQARERVPAARLVVADAQQMDFPSDSFDLVMESTVFLQMTDEVMAGRIAAEMIRVTKPGGYLVLRDWRVGRPGDLTHAPLNRARLRRLFRVGELTRVDGRERAALLPPVGRALSRLAPWAYTLVHGALPFLAAQVVTRLRKDP